MLIIYWYCWQSIAVTIVSAALSVGAIIAFMQGEFSAEKGLSVYSDYAGDLSAGIIAGILTLVAPPLVIVVWLVTGLGKHGLQYLPKKRGDHE